VATQLVGSRVVLSSVVLVILISLIRHVACVENITLAL
jgi:hypothetical protein